MPIRIEIDTNLPAGWQTAISLLADFYTFPVQHFDLPSAFATKLHACLFRKYTKGRDFYDLLWYLGKKVQPNLDVLNNAIAQTEKKAAKLNGTQLQQKLLGKISRLDDVQLRQDVGPFLVHAEELSLLDKQLMRQVVQNYNFTIS